MSLPLSDLSAFIRRGIPRAGREGGIFTIAGRGRGRKRTGNCLLALARRAGPAACAAPLVLGRRGRRAAVLLLLLRRGWWWCAGSIEYVGYGRAGRSGARRGGLGRAQTRVRRAGGAMESLLHISDARLESLELRGSRVDLLLPARDGLGLLMGRIFVFSVSFRGRTPRRPRHSSVAEGDRG